MRLFLAVLEWRHGDYETLSHKIVHADTLEEAEDKLRRHLASMWADTVLDEDGFHPRCGFPAVRISSIREVSVDDLLDDPVLNVK